MGGAPEYSQCDKGNQAFQAARGTGRTEVSHKSQWGLRQASWERGPRARVGAQAGHQINKAKRACRSQERDRTLARGEGETPNSEAEVSTGDPGPPLLQHHHVGTETNASRGCPTSPLMGQG